jgi:hypothetical protein
MSLKGKLPTLKDKAAKTKEVKVENLGKAEKKKKGKK